MLNTSQYDPYRKKILAARNMHSLSKIIGQNLFVINKYFDDVVQKICEFADNKCLDNFFLEEDTIIDLLSHFNKYREKAVGDFISIYANKLYSLINNDECSDYSTVKIAYPITCAYLAFWIQDLAIIDSLSVHTVEKMIDIYNQISDVIYSNAEEVIELQKELFASQICKLSTSVVEYEQLVIEALALKGLREDIASTIKTLNALYMNTINRSIAMDPSMLSNFLIYQKTMKDFEAYKFLFMAALGIDDDMLTMTVSEVSILLQGIEKNDYTDIAEFAYFWHNHYGTPLPILKLFMREVAKRQCDHFFNTEKFDNEYSNLIANEKKLDQDDIDRIFFNFLPQTAQLQIIEEDIEKFNKEYPEEEYASEAFDKLSRKVSKATSKIYGKFRHWNDNARKIDNEVTGAVKAMGKVAVGDTRTQIIEGKSWTVLGLLKKLLGTVAIFSFGPIKGLIALLIRYALKKKTTDVERRKIIAELDSEIEIIEEKIEDAKSEGNAGRKAKYSMMRTRAELIKARERIRAGMGNSDAHTINLSKNAIANARGELGGNERRISNR